MKNIPIRTCMGCYEPKPKRDLIRIVKSNDGIVSIDLTGKKNGRGAYICKSESCLEKAIKSKRLNKAFSMAISEELYEKLKTEISREEE